jgi:hypothetical protein
VLPQTTQNCKIITAHSPAYVIDADGLAHQQQLAMSDRMLLQSLGHAELLT